MVYVGNDRAMATKASVATQLGATTASVGLGEELGATTASVATQTLTAATTKAQKAEKSTQTCTLAALLDSGLVLDVHVVGFGLGGGGRDDGLGGHADAHVGDDEGAEGGQGHAAAAASRRHPDDSFDPRDPLQFKDGLGRPSSRPPRATKYVEWTWDAALGTHVNLEGHFHVGPAPALGFGGPPMPQRRPPLPGPRPHVRGGGLLIHPVWDGSRLVSC